jgi:glucose/arabinose dehydrogenase
VISPSGMTFTADAIPGWKGNLLIEASAQDRPADARREK